MSFFQLFKKEPGKTGTQVSVPVFQRVITGCRVQLKCGRIISRVFFIFIYFLCGLASVVSANSQSQPTIAIISDEEANVLSDLLLSELTAKGAYHLVERDDIWRARRELTMDAGMEEMLILGRQVKADGLIFIAQRNDLLSVRLVEVERGVRLFEFSCNFSDGNLTEVARDIAKSLNSHKVKLQVPLTGRIFVSLLPTDVSELSQSDQIVLGKLDLLLSFQLSQYEQLFLVERAWLDTVQAEKDLDVRPENSFLNADAIITLKARYGEKLSNPKLDVRIEKPGFKDVFFKSFDLDLTDINASSGKVRDFISSKLVPEQNRPLISLIDEAELYELAAHLYAQHYRYAPALERLHLAYLLDPSKTDRRQEFVKTVADHLSKDMGGTWREADILREEDYMRLIYWLGQAITLQRQTPEAGLSPLIEQRVYRFLTRDTRGFSEKNRFAIHELRAHLKDFFEAEAKDVSPLQGRIKFNALADLCPLFFDQPQPALGYLRTLRQNKRFPQESLRENIFLNIRYWPEEQAKKAWLTFLDEDNGSGTISMSMNALIAACFATGAFDQNVYMSANLPQAREAAVKLFDQLDKNRSAKNWMLNNETGYVHLRLWFALRALPLEQQDHYYANIMLALVKAHPSEERNALNFLRYRWLENIYNKKKPDDISMIQTLILRLHEVVGAGRSFDDWLKPMLTAQWVAQVFSAPMGGQDLVFPDFPHARLIFDSAAVVEGGPRQTHSFFDGFNAYMDGNVLWLAWSSKNGMGIGRVDLRSEKVDHYSIDLGEAEFASYQNPFQMSRWGEYLWISGSSRICRIPVRPDFPYIDLSRVSTTGPQIGTHQLGFPFKTRPEKNVAAMVAVKEGLYFALSFGAVYFWNGKSPTEQMVNSNSLEAGPLNSCQPYDIFAAVASPTGEDLYFFMTDSPGQSSDYGQGQRNGVWKYNLKTKKWTQLLHRSFGFPGESMSLSWLRDPDTFEFGTAKNSFRFDLNQGSLDSGNFQVFSPNHDQGFATDYSKDYKWQILKLVNKNGTTRELLRVEKNIFWLRKVFAFSGGYYVLLSGLQPGGLNPSNRGLVYFIPLPAD